MRNITFLLAIISFISLNSCQDGLSDCFKGNGDPVYRAFSVTPFSEIRAFDGLHINIIQGDEYQVSVKAGSNSISGVQVSSENGILSLSDEIACEWSRKHDVKEVTIQCPDLRVIHQNGYGTIQSLNTLAFDTLMVRAREGNGDIQLDIHTTFVDVETSRNGMITLSGKTKRLYVKYFSNNAIFEGRGLEALNIDIHHRSNNSFHLYPKYALRGKMLRKGNVYLYQMPDLLEVEITGKGSIIDQSVFPSGS